MGLRTLVFAEKELSQQEYDRYNKVYSEAQDMPGGPKGSKGYQEKKAKIQLAYRMVEVDGKDLKLAGASAIEDKLQVAPLSLLSCYGVANSGEQDGVPETLATLREAGIKIWVLTGDKQDTAIQIGYSANLLEQGRPIIILNDEGDPPEVVERSKLPKDATDEQKAIAREEAVKR